MLRTRRHWHILFHYENDRGFLGAVPTSAFRLEGRRRTYRDHVSPSSGWSLTEPTTVTTSLKLTIVALGFSAFCSTRAHGAPSLHDEAARKYVLESGGDVSARHANNTPLHLCPACSHSISMPLGSAINFMP